MHQVLLEQAAERDLKRLSPEMFQRIIHQDRDKGDVDESYDF